MPKRFPKPHCEFDVPVYGGRVYLYLTDRQYRAAASYLRNPVSNPDPMYGRFMYLRNERTGEPCYLLGWFNHDYTVLVHEAAHCTLGILEHVGIHPQAGNGEPYCYLLQALLLELPDAAPNKG